MSEIAENLRSLRARIARAEAAADRVPGSVYLLAVSKTQPAEAVRAAWAAGQAAFGENYVQEGLEKIAALADLPLEWHFIGPLQSNKSADVAAHFHWLHSLDRDKLARRLAAQRPAHLPPLQVCLQVNIDDEASKSGCTPAGLPALAQAVLALPQLELRGLMCIPRPGNSAAFADLAKTRQDLLASIPGLSPARFDTLSMGMSDDLEAAVAAGSTLVRVGTAIFGARPKPAAA
jgi:pyridoxal phosphate enzyme (YggS family)